MENEDDQVQGESEMEPGSQVAGSQDDGLEDQEDSAADDDIFKNNHDLIGVQGILRAQKNEIEKKKVSYKLAWIILTLILI